jgi:hypothetical protein
MHQRGTHLFTMGAIAAIRNVGSHSLAEPSADEHSSGVQCASLLARQVAEARRASPVWAGS